MILSIEILNLNDNIALNNLYDVRKRIKYTIDIETYMKRGLLCYQQQRK